MTKSKIIDLDPNTKEHLDHRSNLQKRCHAKNNYYTGLKFYFFA